MSVVICTSIWNRSGTPCVGVHLFAKCRLSSPAKRAGAGVAHPVSTAYMGDSPGIGKAGRRRYRSEDAGPGHETRLETGNVADFGSEDDRMLDSSSEYQPDEHTPNSGQHRRSTILMLDVMTPGSRRTKRKCQI